MMAKPRIILQVSEEGGQSGNVEIYVNGEGLALLIEELQALSKRNDHFHLFAPQWGMPDGPLRLTPYDSNQATAGHLKVLYRPDDWDKEHFPEVLAAHQIEKCEGVNE